MFYSEKFPVKGHVAFVILVWFFLLLLFPSLAKAQGDINDDLLEMSLEELMAVEIEPTATLTPTSRRMQPSAVTTITKEEIQASGARSLNELLDIYVPNLQMILHHWESRHLGMRGIINDREEKYLLLVNGRVMNERSHYGVLSERDLSMFGDIHHIDVIRGPGSAIYGAGAVSMVISITTLNALTFEGLEVSHRTGAVEEFYNLELKYGKRTSDEGGFFAYFGIDEYKGADQDDAPFVLGADFNDLWGRRQEAGEEVDYKINDYREAYRGLSRIKTHLEYTDGPFEVWARYTRGGENYTFAQDNLGTTPHGWMSGADLGTYPTYNHFYQPGSGYQQFTLFGGYKQEISDAVTIDYSLSYDLFDFERASFNSKKNAQWNLSHREDEYLFRSLLNWEIDDKHSLAFGGEWSHEIFGLDSLGFPHDDVMLAPFERAPFFGDTPRWARDTYSLMGEEQWRLSDEWTAFVGARVDKTRLTDYLFSPRLSLMFAPNAQQTWKVTGARSQRMTFAEQMQHRWELAGEESDSEEMDSVELRYEHQLSPDLWYAVTGFYFDLDVIAWDAGASYGQTTYGGTTNVGDSQQYGLELEVRYQKGALSVLGSHGFTKLLDFNNNQGVTNILSSEPFGYGDDLANWSNHITKVVGTYRITEQWNVSGNTRIYWGFPGAKSYAKYVTDSRSPYSREPGYDDPYGPSVFVGLGVQYQPEESLTLRLDGHDLLGLVDKKYNKTLYGFNSYADYRSSAPAVSFSLSYKF